MVSLLAETWTWYGVVVLVVLVRLISRILHFGTVRRLQLDDFLMIAVLCFYTTEVITLNIVSNTQTNLLPPGYLSDHALSIEDIKSRERGSKIILVIEQCQIATIWLVKACLLIMYHRVTSTSFRRQNIAIRILAAYVAFGFVFMEIFYFGVWCRPFHDYWAVPTPSIQCSAAIHHLITNAVFNLSSDLIMLSIALPMFMRSQLPLRRKIILCSVFGLGVFVIIAAVLNKYYSFTDPFGSQWEQWYIRESSTAVLVANIPFTWTSLRRVFGIKSFDGEDSNPDESAATSPISPVKKRLSLLRDRPPSFVDVSYQKKLRLDMSASSTATEKSPISDPASPSSKHQSWRSSGAALLPGGLRPGVKRNHSLNSATSDGHSTNRWLGREDRLAREGLDDPEDSDSDGPSKTHNQPGSFVQCEYCHAKPEKNGAAAQDLSLQSIARGQGCSSNIAMMV